MQKMSKCRCGKEHTSDDPFGMQKAIEQRAREAADEIDREIIAELKQLSDTVKPEDNE